MRKYTIAFDKERYTSSKGQKEFGDKFYIIHDDKDKVEAIIDALSQHFDAGLTDQFYIEEEEI
jgi:hypothetical protein